MKACVYFVAWGIAVGPAFADEATIPITVRQVTHVKPGPHAFSGVGSFQVYRGEKPLPGATCPDLSNNEGRLSCTVTCDKKDVTAKPLRVVPPSQILRVRGYVAPPSANVELKGCAIAPVVGSTFIYKDSQIAFAELLGTNPQLAQFIKPGKPAGTYELAAVNDALPVMTQFASTPEGAETLASLNKATSALADRTQDTDPAKAELLSAYTVGIHNVFLNQVVKKKAGIQIPEGFKVSGKKTDYYNNLGLVEQSLDSKVARSPQQTKLLNDVQLWKRQPIDPARHDQLYRIVAGRVDGRI